MQTIMILMILRSRQEVTGAKIKRENDEEKEREFASLNQVLKRGILI